MRRVIGVALLGMVVLAGCSSGKSSILATTTTTSRDALHNAVPADLRLTIFDRLPANFIEEPDGSTFDGPLNLAETATAVDDQETAKQEAILQQFGFRSAYQRTWIVKDSAEMLIIRVQDMGSPKQALGYFNLLTFADRASGQLTTFPTPQLVAASGFTRLFTTSTGNQVSQDINLVRGPLFYHLIFTGPQGLVSPSNVLSLAKSQSTEAATLGWT